MNCPVCNRNNAVTLSICPSCGAMINDSVREELELVTKPVARKTTPPPPSSSPTVVTEKKVNFAVPNKPVQPSAATITASSPTVAAATITTTQAATMTTENTPASSPLQKPLTNKVETTEFVVKPTAPTLVEFHNKNATVPEWRLQLQNAVRQRQNRSRTETNVSTNAIASAPQAKLVTSGANALKSEPIVAAEPEIVLHENPKINSALQRIEKARQQFFEEEKTEETKTVENQTDIATPAAPNKNYPFYIASKSNEPMAATPKSEIKASSNFAAVNKSVTVVRTEKKDFDTNKLPPISKVLVETETTSSVMPNELKSSIHDTQKPGIKLVEPALEEEEIIEDETEEIEDLAPFAMRFNAGLFDLIIGSFLSFLLMTPFMLMNESWFTVPGLLAFLVTCSVVMFLYMTITIGLYGKTFGMRLFSLELVDIEGEDYPTIHQAAVSSAVYLLSLALGGIGFITLPFNEEKRALHDLASKTIVVKEL